MSDDRVPVPVDRYWPDDAEENESVVVNWFVREGRTVDEGDTLCEIQVEKVSVDATVPAAGTLDEIEVPEDGQFARGDTLAWIRPE
jgi:pyruvate/2-oxoglutarate dehydrogenase complex dihydrolipoamide acyltransferase (E2) component